MTRTKRDREFTAYVAARRTDLLRAAGMMTAGDMAQAEDLVQTALTKVYLHWNRIRPDPGPHAYACRALATTFVDERRRPWRRERSGAELPDLVAAEPPDHRLPADLEAALTALPARMRAAVVLRHLCQLSVGQAAQALGCSEGTVKSQTARGLDQLRSTLTPVPTPDPDFHLARSTR